MKNLSTVLVVLAAGSSYVAALPTRGPHAAVQARTPAGECTSPISTPINGEKRPTHLCH